MKTIATGLQLNGPKAFQNRPKYERDVIMQIIRERHSPIRRQEVIGDFVVMLGQMVKEPINEGNYVVYDTTTERQKVVSVYQHNCAWYVSEASSTVKSSLAHFNQPYYRWVQIHPLDTEVLKDLRRRE